MLDVASAKPTVNGIDLQALDDAVQAITEDPSRAAVTFRVTTDWRGQCRSETTVESIVLGGETVERSFRIDADEPLELLGRNTAPNPQELLMAAVNACMTVGYVAQASVRGITLTSCRIEMDGQLDLRGFLGLDDAVPPGYRRLNYRVHLDGDGTRQQFEEIHQAVMATSPNYFNMARPIEMSATLV